MKILHIPKIPEIYFLEEHNLLQPCAVKVACTVVRGGKLERAYLSQSDQQVYFSGELKQRMRRLKEIEFKIAYKSLK
jgi:hypothetical protein